MDQRITAQGRLYIGRIIMAVAVLVGLGAAPFASAEHPVTTSDVQVKPAYLNKAKPGSPDYVHGLTMAQVVKRFGQPQKKMAAVPRHGGKYQPPIIRWDYPGFTVYFERHIALHLVRDHPVPKR